jgi:hypothetical protein
MATLQTTFTYVCVFVRSVHDKICGSTVGFGLQGLPAFRIESERVAFFGEWCDSW